MSEGSTMIENIQRELGTAWDKAAGEIDTWRCPECGNEHQSSGAVHIEWGNPECDKHDGRTVLMTLVDIRRVSPTPSGITAPAVVALNETTPSGITGNKTEVTE